MAVSKRLRFEIFRRDNHTCRYCGAAAPDVSLTVDHVVPEALGGSDEADNLVTACADCNSGKTSVPPGAPLVEDVAQGALRWAKAMERAAAIQASDQDRFQEFVDHFDALWSDWHVGASDAEDGEPLPLPGDYTQSLHRLYALGLDGEFVKYAIRTAMEAPRVKTHNVFRYFAGVCWRHLEERQDIAASLLEEEGTDGP